MPRRRLAALIGTLLGAGAIGAASRGVIAPAAAAASTPDSTSVDQFMWYDAPRRTAYLQLSSALGGNNGGMNFNGNSSGGATITVPLGWTVRTHYRNLDAIPHSAIIIAAQQPLPAIPQTAAFAGAYTVNLTAGLSTDQTDDMRFTAAPAGRYILMCGVPGHGPSGMWIWFVVSATASAPAYAR
jgi:sulfocyanin